MKINGNKKKLGAFLAVVLAFGFASWAEAGWNFRSLPGIQVNVEYMGYSFRNSSGDPVFHRGDTLRAQITILKSGEKQAQTLTASAVLQWAESAECKKGEILSAGQGLPGPSSSGVHKMDFSSATQDSFEMSYRVPHGVCANQGEVLVEAFYDGQREKMRVPMRFEIRN